MRTPGASTFSQIFGKGANPELCSEGYAKLPSRVANWLNGVHIAFLFEQGPPM